MRKTTHISLSEAKLHLGELVKRTSYGGERFVLEFRGKPQAVIVSYEEAQAMDSGAFSESLDEARDRLVRLREQSREYSAVPFDSTEEIRKLREGRADEFGDLRR
jgi:prevent-host-death family protein